MNLQAEAIEWSWNQSLFCSNLYKINFLALMDWYTLAYNLSAESDSPFN